MKKEGGQILEEALLRTRCVPHDTDPRIHLISISCPAKRVHQPTYNTTAATLEIMVASAQQHSSWLQARQAQKTLVCQQAPDFELFKGWENGGWLCYLVGGEGPNIVKDVL